MELYSRDTLVWARTRTDWPVLHVLVHLFRSQMTWHIHNDCTICTGWGEKTRKKYFTYTFLMVNWKQDQYLSFPYVWKCDVMAFVFVSSRQISLQLQGWTIITRRPARVRWCQAGRGAQPGEQLWPALPPPPTRGRVPGGGTGTVPAALIRAPVSVGAQETCCYRKY